MSVHPSEVDLAGERGWKPAGWDTLHISRSFESHMTPIEDDCPCPQEPCGYVARDKVVDECTQHNGMKTIRDMHRAEDCPGHAE